MNINELSLSGAFEIDYFFVGDNRGGFGKLFERHIYEQFGIKFNLSESFFSISQENVVRGLHFQMNNPQAKLVSVLSGRVWDVIVDIRPSSDTFGKWEAVELSSDNHKSLFVPRGFAHGFAALEDNTIMLYQCDGDYDKMSDTGIRFDDPQIGIVWPIDIEKMIHSDRDMKLMSFSDYLEQVNHIPSQD